MPVRPTGRDGKYKYRIRLSFLFGTLCPLSFLLLRLPSFSSTVSKHSVVFSLKTSILGPWLDYGSLGINGYATTNIIHQFTRVQRMDLTYHLYEIEIPELRGHSPFLKSSPVSTHARGSRLFDLIDFRLGIFFVAEPICIQQICSHWLPLLMASDELFGCRGGQQRNKEERMSKCWAQRYKKRRDGRHGLY